MYVHVDVFVVQYLTVKLNNHYFYHCIIESWYHCINRNFMSAFSASTLGNDIFCSILVSLYVIFSCLFDCDIVSCALIVGHTSDHYFWASLSWATLYFKFQCAHDDNNSRLASQGTGGYSFSIYSLCCESSATLIWHLTIYL